MEYSQHTHGESSVGDACMYNHPYVHGGLQYLMQVGSLPVLSTVELTPILKSSAVNNLE